MLKQVWVCASDTWVKSVINDLLCSKKALVVFVAMECVVCPLKIPVLKLILKMMVSVGGGLWTCSGHEGGALRNGNSVPYIRDSRELFYTHSGTGGHGEKMVERFFYIWEEVPH